MAETPTVDQQTATGVDGGSSGGGLAKAGAALSGGEGGLGATVGLPKLGAEGGPRVEVGEQPVSESGVDARAGEKQLAGEIGTSLETGTPPPGEMLQNIADKPTLLDEQRGRLDESRVQSTDDLQAKVDAGDASIYDQRALSEKKKGENDAASEDKGDTSADAKAEDPDDNADQKPAWVKAALQRGFSRMRQLIRRGKQAEQSAEPPADQQESTDKQAEEAATEAADNQNPESETANQDSQEPVIAETDGAETATEPPTPPDTADGSGSGPDADADSGSGQQEPDSADTATPPPDGSADDGEPASAETQDSDPDANKGEQNKADTEDDSTEPDKNPEKDDTENKADSENQTETPEEKQKRLIGEIEAETQKRIDALKAADPSAEIDEDKANDIRMDVMEEKFHGEIEAAKAKLPPPDDLGHQMDQELRSKHDVLKNAVGEEYYKKVIGNKESAEDTNKAENEKDPRTEVLDTLKSMGLELTEAQVKEINEILNNPDLVGELRDKINEAKETADIMIKAAQDAGKDVNEQDVYQMALKSTLEKFAQEKQQDGRFKNIMKLIGFLLWQMTRIGVEGTARIPVEISKHSAPVNA